MVYNFRVRYPIGDFFVCFNILNCIFVGSSLTVGLSAGVKTAIGVDADTIKRTKTLENIS